MPYRVTPTSLPDVLILEPQVFSDDRGFFFESFNARDFETATGVSTIFVQDNHSRSRRNVLRGLHYQIKHPQGKLVRVAEGEIFDVAVDLRRASAHFGKWTGVSLSSANKRQLWIPPGFAHGFLAISQSAEVLYKTTEYWHPEYERSLIWNDPQLNIAWPLNDEPMLAAKDSSGAQLNDAETF
jgi:dTDP-4-dehydrorhamnose 3,5-epimerase